MALKFTQNDAGGAFRRRPLLPDDRYLDGYLNSLEEANVEDKFNGGMKDVIVFSFAIPEFEDPQGDGSLPRMVRIKVNTPKNGKVHSKSKLYKLCVALNGGVDPWAKTKNFDIEALIGNGLRLMMQNSEPMEKEVEEADGTVHIADDFQYQYVTMERVAAPGKEKWTKNGWSGGASASSAPAKKTAKKTTTKKAEEPEPEGEDYVPSVGDTVEVEEDGTIYTGTVKKVLARSKKAVVDFDGQDETHAFASLVKVEVDEEEVSEDEEGEESEELGEELAGVIVDGLKALAKTAAGKKKVAAALKKAGVSGPKEIAAMSSEDGRALAASLKIELPEEGGDDLSFLD